MQKLVNVIALLSGLVSLSLIAGSSYLLLNKDTLIEDAREKVTAAVAEAVAGTLPALIDAQMPKMPGATGPAIPVGETGPAIRLP